MAPVLKMWQRFVRFTHHYLSLNFLVKTKNAALKKQWSLQRRILTTAVVSVFILAAALIVGGGIYAIGRLLGIFQTQSLQKLVYRSVVEDSEFVRLVQEEAQKTTCTNTYLGFSYAFAKPVQPVFMHGVEACLLVKVPFGERNDGLVLSFYQEEKEAVLERALRGYTDIETESFNHPLYTGTIVRGTKQHAAVLFIALETAPSVTWTFEYFPDEPKRERVVTQLIHSFRTVVP